MTQETDDLSHQIQTLRSLKEVDEKVANGQTGYGVAVSLIATLFGCIVVGLALGLFIQHMFNVSTLWVAGMTMLGGITGLWSVVRYAIALEKRERDGK
ncbi:MAG: hypothetical protein LBU87_06480 [Lactobacillales bacterium]|jgi:F0F1-type ATP synthase assembly protein I|nr:hypothetical protein [Lactobacillales bacterium]